MQLYFDYNATTPVLPRVFEAMRPFFMDRFGNPGCGHAWGLSARRAMDAARAQVAGLVGARPEEVFFTSCATESNNMVLWGLFRDAPGAHLITTAVEHPAILEPARVLERRGVAVSRLGVDEQGRLDPETVAQAIRPETRLVSLMLANNETGALFPVAEVAALARERGVLVHTDASQAVGKIPVNFAELGVDLMTIAGHKLYAPKGVGALVKRSGVELSPSFQGGGQEGGLRPGTENIAYMVALGEASAMAAEDLEAEMARQRALGARFLAGLDAMGAAYRLHSALADRLPNTMSIGFDGLRAGDLLSGLVGEDAGVSAGAACHGETTTASHVLTAMGVPDRWAHGTLRFSWGRPTTEAEVDELLVRLKRILASLAGA